MQQNGKIIKIGRYSLDDILTLKKIMSGMFLSNFMGVFPIFQFNLGGRMMKKLAMLTAAVMMFGALLTGCSATEDVIKIGYFEPLTGANAGGGTIEAEGIELAHKLYPEVLGKKVELIKVDNKSDKAESANAASRLVDQEKVVAVIGSWGSGLAMAAGPIFKEAKIPAVGASCTNPLVTEGNDYYFRVCFIDPYQGKVMANYAYNKLGARKAAILRETSSDYSVGLAKFFVEAFTELTGDPNCIVATMDYNTGDQDFNAQVTNIAKAKPDVVFAPGNYSESAMAIKQARTLGITVPFLGGDTWETPEFLSIGGKEVEGIVLSTSFDQKAAFTDETSKFVEAYKSEYNKEPAAFTALGYDAYCLILDAITRANSTDTVAIRDAIAATDGFQGAAGSIKLDTNGDAIKPAVIKTVKDGKFVYESIVEAAS